MRCFNGAGGIEQFDLADDSCIQVVVLLVVGEFYQRGIADKLGNALVHCHDSFFLPHLRQIAFGPLARRQTALPYRSNTKLEL